MIDFTYAVFSFWSLRNAAVTAAELSHLCRPKTTSGIVRKRICGPPCINGQKKKQLSFASNTKRKLVRVLTESIWAETK